jgi:hypothetical protein
MNWHDDSGRLGASVHAVLARSGAGHNCYSRKIKNLSHWIVERLFKTLSAVIPLFSVSSFLLPFSSLASIPSWTIFP